ncbi:MAG: hypothetical protein ACT4OK_10170 [Gemmobacter sp.]
MPDDDNDDDEGGGLDLDTSALKKYIKKLATRTMAFSYAPPAGSEGEPVFTLHRTKKPVALSKAVKKEKKEKEEPGNKLSFGSITMQDGVLVLTCEKEVSGMQKKLAKMFREKRVRVDFKIVGRGGDEVA